MRRRKDEYYHFGETHHHRRHHNSFGITNFWLPQKLNDPWRSNTFAIWAPVTNAEGPQLGSGFPTVPLSYTYKASTTYLS